METGQAVIAIVMARGQAIGIHGEHVVQAIVVPHDMTLVPRRAGGLAGVIVHANQPVPVVSLEHWLRPDDGDSAASPLAADARIVLLREGDRLIGLLVDAVVGLRRCSRAAVTRICHDDDPDELFVRAVLIDAGEPAVALLEPSRLFARAAVWAEAAQLTHVDQLDQATVNPDAVEPSQVDSRALADQPTSLGVFRIGDALVGIAASEIGELLLRPELRPPPFHHSAARGLCDWRGRLLPVVDLSSALGAISDTRAPAWMCVLRHGELALGVLVNEIITLHATQGDSDTCERPNTAALVRRELPSALGMLQLLDTAALMAAYPESSISAAPSGTSIKAGPATCPHTYVVFEAAGGYAARIDCVQEVVPLPAAMRARLDAGLAVSLPWRGHAVPVRGLFAQADQCMSAADARQLIVVVSGERRAAIPITGVKAMVAPHSATRSRVRMGRELVEVISTGANSGRQTSFALVELSSSLGAC